MLVFAQDITNKGYRHPEEENDPALKEYMDYHRAINVEKLVYHSLDHGQTYLRKKILDGGEDKEKLLDYVREAFPVSREYVPEPDTLAFMLRKLINGHNSSKYWYRMNHFYYGVVYDSLERFIKIFNRLLKSSPEKAESYDIAKREIDFADFVQLYFNDLDFMAGRKPDYVHFPFTRRNQAILDKIENEMLDRKSKAAAVEAAQDEFGIQPAACKIILGKKVTQSDLELYYTSIDNPIYESLVAADSADGFMDGEAAIDRAYFMAFRLKGLGEAEAEEIVNQTANINKIN